MWLYLYFPMLQLEGMTQQTVSSDFVTPVVIIDGRKNQIVQLNNAAQQRGIKIGMGLGTACALCTQLHVLPYDDLLERQQLLEIANMLYQVSADIVIDEPNGLVLKVDSMLSLYHDLPSYWQMISQHLAQLGMSYYYGTGESTIMAKLLAREHCNVLVLTPCQKRHYLGKIGLTRTSLNSRVVELLARTGVKNVAQLEQFALSELAKRFDTELVHYVGCLFGKLKETLNYYQPAETFELTAPLLYEVEVMAWLEKPIEHLLSRLALFLQQRNLVTRTLYFTLALRDKEALEITLNSAEPEYKAANWLRLLNLKLESITLDAPVQSVSLKADVLETQHATIKDLFSTQQSAMSAQGLRAILCAKLGEQAVQGLQLTGDPRPEKASTYSREPHFTTLESKLRPTILFLKPQPLCERVNIISGPERIASGWWDGEPVLRDYFIVQNEQAQRLWVFREQNNHWYIHGVFS
ncbi:Y-family DNA polymerase [Pseudoalteromonas piscicida]|uniref:DNA polymerase Y family protein n=1 Tax=Pseudoalteromonas piscicida TaxID=43662 RepID=A0AAD0RI54_PSEO7|nr:DNA polymerase Y family protein [Pseudoalteromonas piscicida]ASD66410.1 nucleotidyltransferase [Pseudoalteromonas piscicida]AXR02881.1 DNA polymerase Y family protein [Pseudoalteromonas piscicida]